MRNKQQNKTNKSNRKSEEEIFRMRTDMLGRSLCHYLRASQSSFPDLTRNSTEHSEKTFSLSL